MQSTGLQAARVSSTRTATFSLRSGQLSIETLLILLLFLIVLGISYAAASRIGASAQKSIQASLSKTSCNEFSSKLSEACALGNGNVRVVEVKGEPATVYSEGKAYTFSAGAFASAANSSCEVSVLQSLSSKHFTITNKGGKIEVS